MSSDEMFESSVRSSGDLAGVFEHDGDTGYFYLYDLLRDEDQRVVGAIRIASACPAFDHADLLIKWNGGEEFVGLFIKGALWAAFEGNSRDQFGGNFTDMGEATMPEMVIRAFE